MNTKTLSIAAFAVVVLVAALSLYSVLPILSSDTQATSTSDGSVACTMEAKMCPDGTAVGRSGPNCEFAACPVSASASYQTGDAVTVAVRMGETVTVLGEKITPTAVLEDSRCPTDVQCIWAGTVRVKATVLTGMGNGNITFELGQVSGTEINSFTLVSVTPATKSTQSITPSDYIFTLKVTRR